MNPRNFSTDADTGAKLGQSLKDASERVHAESERLASVPGLPTDFWKVLDIRTMECALKGFDLLPPAQATSMADPVQYFRNVQAMQKNLGYEVVARVEFVNMRPDLIQNACDKLQKLAPGIRSTARKLQGEVHVALGAVVDFQAFASGIDFGNVLVRNDSKRFLRLAVDPMKLGAPG